MALGIQGILSLSSVHFPLLPHEACSIQHAQPSPNRDSPEACLWVPSSSLSPAGTFPVPV